MNPPSASPINRSRAWPAYQQILRWHCYAGLFCIPFVLVLSLTGSIYLFKPQLDAADEDRIEVHASTALIDDLFIDTAALAIEKHRSDNAETPIVAYQIPRDNLKSHRLVTKSGRNESHFVYDAATQAQLGVLDPEQQLSRVVRRFHGQLGLGKNGSYIVELASSWTIVMILSGLYLWWPRGRWSLRGTFVPRLVHALASRNKKLFWRDLHSVTGIWISLLALVILASGLPWAQFWGSYFKLAKETAALSFETSWTIGGEEVKAKPASDSANLEMAQKPASKDNAGESTSFDHAGEHAQHSDHAQHSGMKAGGRPRRGDKPFPDQLDSFRTVLKVALAEKLPYPTQIQLVDSETDTWIIDSQTQNRPLRGSLKVRGSDGQILERSLFSEKPFIDRLTSYGIAFHEGQLFGVWNQMLNLIVASGLVLLSMSGLIMWQRRKISIVDRGDRKPLAWSFLLVIVILAVYLPMFGLSAIVIVLFDRWFFGGKDRSDPN